MSMPAATRPLHQLLTYKRHSPGTKIYGCVRIEEETAISNQGKSLFLQYQSVCLYTVCAKLLQRDTIYT